MAIDLWSSYIAKQQAENGYCRVYIVKLRSKKKKGSIFARIASAILCLHKVCAQMYNRTNALCDDNNCVPKKQQHTMCNN